MKKLISAVCLLLVATVMLGSTTFAWFSMNTEVTATGLSVTATAPNTLLISTSTTAGTAGQTVALESETTVASKIVPVTYNTVYTFAKLNDKGCALVNDLGATTGAAATEVAAFKTGSATAVTTEEYIEITNVDYFKDTIYLTYTGSEATAESAGIKLTAAWVGTAPTDNIKNAMHVLLVGDDGTKYNLDMTDAATGVQLADIETNAANPTTYTVYYYLDGEDTDCVTKNITADTTLSVTLTFKVTAAVEG